MADKFIHLVSKVVGTLPVSTRQSLYKMGPLSKIIRSGLNRLVPEDIAEVSIAAGYFKGINLALDLKAEKEMWLGTYEPELQQAIIEYVKPGMTAYDIGANVGFISLLLSKMVGDTGTVFAFEALPKNIQRLRANLLLNPFASNVEIIQNAVVDSEREIDFMLGPSLGMGKVRGSAGRDNVEYGDVIVVPGVSLDGFVYKYGNPAPDIVKMDIEGGEILALPGMLKVIKEDKPVLFLELHGPEAVEIVWDTLSGAGYHFRQMKEGNSRISSKDELDWKNYLVAIH